MNTSIELAISIWSMEDTITAPLELITVLYTMIEVTVNTACVESLTSSLPHWANCLLYFIVVIK